MRLEVDRTFFGEVEIPLDCFESLASAHFQGVPQTAEVEAQARRLVAQEFPESDIEDFIQKVCKWGGHPGIGGRVLKHNTLADIRSALQDAISHLSEPTSDLVAAMCAVNRVKYLGSLSFASKHLRFLCPDLCPVFDSYLQAALPYSFDGTGYSLFAADCLRLAQELTKRGAVSPWPGRDGQWFAADVEAAIFQFIRSRGEKED